MLRPCVGLPNEPCSGFAEGDPRCPEHKRRWKQLRNADRPIARAVVAASPVCVDCGSTKDLTADHLVRLIEGGTNDGPREVVCRSCNSKRNRGR